MRKKTINKYDSVPSVKILSHQVLFTNAPCQTPTIHRMLIVTTMGEDQPPIDLNSEPPIPDDATPTFGMEPIKKGDTKPLGELPEQQEKHNVPPLHFSIEGSGTAKTGEQIQVLENGIMVAGQDAGAIGRREGTGDITGAVVADGMGGYEGSEHASQSIVDNIRRTALENPEADTLQTAVTEMTRSMYAVSRSIRAPLEREIETAQRDLKRIEAEGNVDEIRQAEERLTAIAKKRREAPDTTVTAVRYIQDEKGRHLLVIAHNGDTRASIIRQDGQLVPLTHDENLVWTLLAPDERFLRRDAHQAVLDGELDSFVSRQLTLMEYPTRGMAKMAWKHSPDLPDAIFAGKSNLATFIQEALDSVQSPQDLDALDHRFQEFFGQLPEDVQKFVQKDIEKNRQAPSDAPVRLHDFWNNRNLTLGLRVPPQVIVYEIQKGDRGFLVESDGTTDQTTIEQRENVCKQHKDDPNFEQTIPGEILTLVRRAHETGSGRIKRENDDQLVMCGRIEWPAAPEQAPPPQQ